MVFFDLISFDLVLNLNKYRFQPPTSQPNYHYGGQQNAIGFRNSDYPPSLLSLDISSNFKRSGDFEQDVSGFRHLSARNQQYTSNQINSDTQRNGTFFEF